jgi:uncharacterized protein GlcG (DUF336 family)
VTHAQARALVDRAIAKTREFDRATAFVVVDAGGNVVSAASMDGAPPAAIVLARAKAYLAAMDHAPTAYRADRWNRRTVMYHAYASCFATPIFPGAGGLPIARDGTMVGAIATGPGVGGIEVEIPGYEGPVILEDFLVAYAIDVPYLSRRELVGHAP